MSWKNVDHQRLFLAIELEKYLKNIDPTLYKQAITKKMFSEKILSDFSISEKAFIEQEVSGYSWENFVFEEYPLEDLYHTFLEVTKLYSNHQLKFQIDLIEIGLLQSSWSFGGFFINYRKGTTGKVQLKLTTLINYLEECYGVSKEEIKQNLEYIFLGVIRSLRL